MKAKNPSEPEFHQAVAEVVDSLAPVLDRHPEYRAAKILERVVEPERVLMFRVPWIDDRGEVQVNRGFRIQMFLGFTVASGLLFLFLRRDGHGAWACLLGTAAFAVSPAVAEVVRYPFLVDPVTVSLEIAFLLAVQGGGGPTGMSAALFLSARGVPVTVLERSTEPYSEPRAATYHPPTLELLDPSGITRQLHERGIVVRRWQFRGRREGLVAEFDLGVLASETRYPYRLQCEQHKLVQMLEQHLAGSPLVQIHRGWSVEDLQQHWQVGEHGRPEHPAEPHVNTAEHGIGQDCHGPIRPEVTVLNVHGEMRIEPAAHAGHERVYSAAHLLEDFGARPFPVRGRVLHVAELLGHEGEGVLLQYLLRSPDRSFHLLRGGREDDLGAVGREQLPPLEAHVVGHREYEPVSLDGAHESEPDPRVPARGLDYHALARLNGSRFFRGRDHLKAYPFLDAASGVQVLELRPYVGRAFRDHVVQFDYRRPADKV